MINIRNRGKHRSLEEWGNILEDWQLSGLSQVEYCKFHNISKSVFYKYHKRLKSSAPAVVLEVDKAGTGEAKFIEARIKQPLLGRAKVEYFSLRCVLLNYVFLLELRRE